MSCRMSAATPRDCVTCCGANCQCELRHQAARDLIAFAKEGAPPAAPIRVGDWMQTATGRQYWPADPRAAEVDIFDIAHSLSMQARYGGHAHSFYSVAEHCVLMADRLFGDGLSRSIVFSALMHDSSEAYLVDVPRPIKGRLRGYREIEARNMEVIAERFGFAWPPHPAVHAADNAILHDERDQAMAPPPADWRLPGEPLGVSLQFWSPPIAKRKFLDAFATYGGVA